MSEVELYDESYVQKITLIFKDEEEEKGLIPHMGAVKIIFRLKTKNGAVYLVHNPMAFGN